MLLLSCLLAKILNFVRLFIEGCVKDTALPSSLKYRKLDRISTCEQSISDCITRPTTFPIPADTIVMGISISWVSLIAISVPYRTCRLDSLIALCCRYYDNVRFIDLLWENVLICFGPPFVHESELIIVGEGVVNFNGVVVSCELSTDLTMLWVQDVLSEIYVFDDTVGWTCLLMGFSVVFGECVVKVCHDLGIRWAWRENRCQLWLE